MMPPILETLDAVAQSQGVVWSEKLAELKKNNQFHVEVY
jgi:ferredoxin--NADP+ reductase